MKSLLVAASIAVLTLLSFFRFPGHTWLEQDTQIYAPILEHHYLVRPAHGRHTVRDDHSRSSGDIVPYAGQYPLFGVRIDVRQRVIEDQDRRLPGESAIRPARQPWCPSREGVVVGR